MIYIILAIYNEERALPHLIGDIRKLFHREPYKIVAVDDGSSDRSLEILKSLSGEDIIIAPHQINLSIGAVFLTGFNTALNDSKHGNDVIVLMESDQTSDVNLLGHLINEIRVKGNDIAIASRYIQEGGYVNFPLARKLYSVCANNIMRKFFPIPGVKDYTIFYRAYRSGLLKQVRDFFGPYSLIQFRRFVSNSELLIKAAYFTDKIVEVPFLYNYGNKKSKSKLMPFKNICEYFYFIVSMKNIEKKVISKRKHHA